MELHQKQSEFIKSTKRFKLLNWGRRSGKTFAVGYEIFIALWEKDNALVSYYAPTRDDARSIAWEDFKDLLKDITTKTNESLLEIETQNKHGGKSLLRLAGWEAVKNRDKGRGVENDLVVLDEAAFFPMFQEKFDKVIEPTLLTSKGRLIITSTPNGFNHFYDLASKAQTDDEWFFSHATSYDNPHNDPDELNRLKEKKTEDAFAQEYLADFRKVEGLVYKEFDRARHVVLNPPMAFTRQFAAVDFGWTNPAAILKIGVDKDDNYYILDEWYEPEKETEEISDMIATYDPEYVYPDPAEPDRIALLRKRGHKIKEVSKDTKAGIGTVNALLKQNRLFIMSHCHNTIFEIEGYKYKEKLDDKNAPEEPVKLNDHCMDAMRYALHMEESRRNMYQPPAYQRVNQHLERNRNIQMQAR